MSRPTGRFLLWLSLFISHSASFIVHNTKKCPLTALDSLSSPQDPSISPFMESNKQSLQDAWQVFAHGASCVLLAMGICAYQDYDCSHLKPLGVLREHALKGMGQGRAERLASEQSAQIVSYNEVMQFHRDKRVPMWHSSKLSESQAISQIIAALDAVQQLKNMAQNYDWDEMQLLIRKPVLTSDFEEACAVLRTTASSVEARDEIGFDWGSCAWRHCGAQADAQESLAELYNLIGVLEPFECQFCLDIVERSIRDILAVTPNGSSRVAPYIPYESKGQEGGDTALDIDYLNALEELKSGDY